MKTTMDKGVGYLEEEWAPFAIAHGLRVGYFLFFHKEVEGVYTVRIFDFSCCERTARCPKHPEMFTRVLPESA
jgi:hypothetical protein